MLEIYQDGDKFFLRYPTFNITMPEVVKEIPKEAVDSYLAREHDGEELIMLISDFGNQKLVKKMLTYNF